MLSVAPWGANNRVADRAGHSRERGGLSLWSIMEAAVNYAMQFARDMEPELADKFIGMYVNKWTLGYGERGRQAVHEFL